jgi:hypothetical protein
LCGVVGFQIPIETVTEDPDRPYRARLAGVPRFEKNRKMKKKNSFYHFLPTKRHDDSSNRAH